MTLDFGEVLTNAWRIIWKHKVLWIFGILAGCGSGGGAAGGGGGSGWREDGSFGSDGFSHINRWFTGIGDWIGHNGWIFVVILLVLLILWALAVFLGTMGRIGLIRGTFQADGGADRLAFGELFRGSMPYFWRVFLLSFLVGLAALVIFVPLVLFGIVTIGIGFLCVLPLLCILVPAIWLANLVVQQASAAIVIENLSLMEGVRRGWGVVKKNLGAVLIIWLITGIIGFVLGIVLALPVLIIMVPAIIGFATSSGDFPTAAVVVAGLCFVLYLPILLAAQGILTGYIESVWALTFLRLTRFKEGMGTLEALPANA